MNPRSLMIDCRPHRLFTSQQHAAVRAELNASMPESKAADVNKRLGEIWKEMSDDQKAAYERLAVLDKERYEVSRRAHSNPALANSC